MEEEDPVQYDKDNHMYKTTSTKGKMAGWYNDHDKQEQKEFGTIRMMTSIRRPGMTTTTMTNIWRRKIPGSTTRTTPPGQYHNN